LVVNFEAPGFDGLSLPIPGTPACSQIHLQVRRSGTAHEIIAE
jgi:hypothetical protein